MGVLSRLGLETGLSAEPQRSKKMAKGKRQKLKAEMPEACAVAAGQGEVKDRDRGRELGKDRGAVSAEERE